MASRPLSSVRPRVVHYLPGTDRSRVLIHSWSMPDRQGICIRCVQHASEFSRTPRLWTKYAIHSLQFSTPGSIRMPRAVARRGETCCHVSALQPKIQVAIRHRPTLACLVCSSELPPLRCRSRRHERPRCGEGRPATTYYLMGLLTKPPAE